MDLTHSVAIVTGGGSGIGRASALALAEAGANVMIADIDGSRAQAVADEITAAGARAYGIALDVTLDDSHAHLRDAAMSRFGRIDVVMNNVGVVTIGPPHEIPLQEWLRVIDVNLVSIVRSNEVFVPHMLEQGHGHLVYTASSEGLFRAQWNQAPYSATKAAVVALCDSLWMYLHPLGIGVTCVAPGPVITNIVEQIRTFGDAGPMVGPNLPLIEPDSVGDAVVRAIRDNAYMVYTHTGMAETAARAAADREAYLSGELHRVADVMSGAAPPPWELAAD
ncbi:SDR family NAD(P)-dependent oxidoreductase [Mycolicibacterium moriokaense]|uniref:NADP-dependent 3-hydroxy acid dehydrogenase YdfG n=1 Tax=Mycolicibacterium moriokaense TaxID=39691 RepID=A0A318H891_9MYCO|nr:SDR family oxidoreductase [Mycolicibacterium moriokaense]PXX01675.1 NADP-dependent 3-hydroxy acid dehydrogenase YdfG [Mycolicibacterium moriokaense]